MRFHFHQSSFFLLICQTFSHLINLLRRLIFVLRFTPHCLDNFAAVVRSLNMRSDLWTNVWEHSIILLRRHALHSSPETGKGKLSKLAQAEGGEFGSRLHYTNYKPNRAIYQEFALKRGGGNNSEIHLPLTLMVELLLLICCKAFIDFFSLSFYLFGFAFFSTSKLETLLIYF